MFQGKQWRGLKRPNESTWRNFAPLSIWMASLGVAEKFGKKRKDVLQAIKILELPGRIRTAEFSAVLL